MSDQLPSVSVANEHRVAYLVSRFPSVTETFVLNEMIELGKLGTQAQVYSFIQDLSLLRHAGVEDFIEDATHVSLKSSACIGAQWYWLTRRPVRYLKLWIDAIRLNAASPRFLARVFVVIPKAATFARAMKTHDIDHIHAHFATHSALAAYSVHRLNDIRYSVTVHAHDLYVDRSMLRQKLAAAHFVATISEFNRDMIARLYGGALASKVHIVRCGVDTAQYQPIEKNDGQRLRLVCVASLQPYKGHRFLIEACAELKRRAIDFHCELIGEGECRDDIEAQLRRFDLTGHVQLSGAQNAQQVRLALAQADIFVLPSIVTESGKMEGIPVALMEAMALELPVISTRISGIPELVRDGSTGRLSEPGDAAQLAQIVAELWNDPQQRRRLGRQARQLVQAQFDLAYNAKVLHKLFESAIGGGEPIQQSTENEHSKASTGE